MKKYINLAIFGLTSLIIFNLIIIIIRHNDHSSDVYESYYSDTQLILMSTFSCLCVFGWIAFTSFFAKISTYQTWIKTPAIFATIAVVLRALVSALNSTDIYYEYPFIFELALFIVWIFLGYFFIRLKQLKKKEELSVILALIGVAILFIFSLNSVLEYIFGFVLIKGDWINIIWVILQLTATALLIPFFFGLSKKYNEGNVEISDLLGIPQGSKNKGTDLVAISKTDKAEKKTFVYAKVINCIGLVILILSIVVGVVGAEFYHSAYIFYMSVIYGVIIWILCLLYSILLKVLVNISMSLKEIQKKLTEEK